MNQPHKPTTKDKPLGDIEHVIVLMFENRSFDNMLGGLYESGPNFDGIPTNWSNPYTHPGSHTVDIPAWKAPTGSSAQIMPNPDPKEDFEDMAEQIDQGSMKGFANNYAKALSHGESTEENVRQIMQYYAPGSRGNIPWTSALAKQYAVSDSYFGSGPVQTWPNRLFAHSGTPGANGSKAYLNNSEYPEYPLINGQLNWKTIFQLLDESNPDPSQLAWKVYYDGEVPISTLFDYVYERWNKIEPGGNVIDFQTENPCYSDFFDDVKQGKLPTYSFIEPRYQEFSAEGIVPPNSNHPGSANAATDDGRPINISYGELMLQQVYQALQNNQELFNKTLLIVTYDEHGGLSDHVKPPCAMSPFTPGTITNFNYDRYGPRVPAIFINPFIAPGTVLRPPEGKYFDHTSIISTLCAQFDLAGPLTRRDGNAPTFSELIYTDMPTPNPGVRDMPDMNSNIPKRKVEPEIEIPKELSPKAYGTLAYAVHHTAFIANKGRRYSRKPSWLKLFTCLIVSFFSRLFGGVSVKKR